MGFLAAWSCVALGMSIPLVGTVHDPSGQPIAGASVMLGDTYGTRTTEELLGSTTTDVAGKFRLDRDEALVGRGGYWSPTLWVFAPGYRVAFEEFKRHVPTADEPVKLVLQPCSGTRIQVRLADGQPASGARAQPPRTNFKAPRPPRQFFDRLAIITDAEGRGTVPGFEAGDFPVVDVTVAGLVTQGLPIPASNSEPKVVTLRPLGRLSVRVTADDLSALQSWKITAFTKPADVSGYVEGTSWVRGTTDPLGIADYRPMAAGRISWKIEAPDNSLYMAADPTGVVVKPDELTEVTIPLQRGSRVVGTIIEAGTGRPLAGVKVRTHCESATLTTDDPVTDASGRFTYTTLPGKNSYTFDSQSIPLTVLVPPDRLHKKDFIIPEGVAEHVLPPIEFLLAALVKGQVIDEAGQPVGGIDVNGSWNSKALSLSTASSAVTNDAGHFTLGRIAPDAEISVSAQIRFRAQSEVKRIVLPDHPGEGTDPLTLQLKTFDTFSIQGRVLGPDGKPFADARVHVLLNGPQSYGQGTELEFTATPDLRTDPQGNFVTPKEVPVGNMYQVQADAPTYTAGYSTWAQPEDRQPVEVRMLQFPGPRTITGRVLDLTGAPVAGVEVFQSGDGPTPTRSTTGPDGRFEVIGVSASPAFLFARSPEHRDTGRLLTASDRSVDLIVTRRDQPSPARLVANQRTDRPEDRAIALEIANNAWQSYLDGDHQPQNNMRPPIFEIMATVDPDRVAAMVENQVITAEPKLLATLAISRIGRDPGEARVFLDSLSPPTIAAQTGLALFDSWSTVQPKEWSRTILDHVAAQTERIDNLKIRAAVLIDLAEAWYQMGDRERGGEAAHTADSLAGPKLDPFTSDVSASKLAVVLAPVDLPAALHRLDQVRNEYQRADLQSKLAALVAASDPAEARRLLGMINGDMKRRTAAASVAVAMATSGNLVDARSLADSNKIDRTTHALLPALAARRLDPSQVDQARDWLGESFDDLARLAAAPVSGSTQSQGPGPLVAMALLLPVASEIDPDHALDYYWLTLASRPPHPFDLEKRSVSPWTRQHYLNLEALAVQIAPFDMAAASAIFDPAATRIPPLDDYTWGLGGEAVALFRTAAAFDGATARAMWAALPDDPPPPEPNRFTAGQPRHQAKADARFDIVRSLGLPPVLRPFDALRTMGPSPWLDALIR